MQNQDQEQQRYGRRAALRLAALGVGAAGLAGCGLFDDEPPGPPPPDPLEPLRAQAVQLADRYDAVILAEPSLAERLAPIREAHRVHVTELTKVIGRPLPSSTPPAVGSSAPPASAPPASGPPASGPPASGPPASVPPGDPAAVLAALKALEQAAARDAVAACLASPPARAGLVGAIAAARTSHLEVL